MVCVCGVGCVVCDVCTYACTMYIEMCVLCVCIGGVGRECVGGVCYECRWCV